MKSNIDKRIAEIDKMVKESTGVDLAKLDKQLESARKSSMGFDFSYIVLDDSIFLVKSRIANSTY